GGVRPPQGGHDRPDRGGPQPPRPRRAEGGVPRGPECDEGPGGAPEELRAPHPRDEGAVGRPERGRGLRRLPRARGPRVPGRGLRVPRGPRDLEGRVQGEDPPEAARVHPEPGREELPGSPGARPRARDPVVGLLWREGEAPGPFRGLVREVLRVGPWRTSRSRSTRGGSTRT